MIRPFYDRLDIEIPFLFYHVPDSNPVGPETVFTDRFWDDKDHWIPDSVGVVPNSLKPYWGKVPDTAVGPLEGDPNAWIAGLSYADWIAGRLPGTCFPLQLPTVRVKVGQKQSIIPQSVIRAPIQQRQTLNAWPIHSLRISQVQTVAQVPFPAYLQQVQRIFDGIVRSEADQVQRVLDGIVRPEADQVQRVLDGIVRPEADQVQRVLATSFINTPCSPSVPTVFNITFHNTGGSCDGVSGVVTYDSVLGYWTNPSITVPGGNSVNVAGVNCVGVAWYITLTTNPYGIYDPCFNNTGFPGSLNGATVILDGGAPPFGPAFNAANPISVSFAY